MDVQINLWAVLLAGLSSMVVGSIWYAQSVFGKTWSNLTKVNMNKPSNPSDMTRLMVSTFLASLLMAYILAHVTYLSNQFFHNSFFHDAMMTGFWLWLGFVVTRFYVHDAFEGRRKKLTILNSAHEFVTIMVMAMIIGAIGI